eukprot:GHUV01040523.1.p1 GENE.GHUV01040523.1~~GHUV01040523.1.p1  ORF type:complete len:140 (+),score=17.41 GHUV01040523.1:124-543(+)
MHKPSYRARPSYSVVRHSVDFNCHPAVLLTVSSLLNTNSSISSPHNAVSSHDWLNIGCPTHHERHKAAVPALPPLFFISWPHNLHAADGTKATKLTSKVGFIHLELQQRVQQSSGGQHRSTGHDDMADPNSQQVIEQRT